jgi:hypothetical protein
MATNPFTYDAATKTYTATATDISLIVIQPGTFTLDGIQGVNTLALGTSLRSAYRITETGPGTVHVDSISSASGGGLHVTLNNIDVLTFNSGADVLNLTANLSTTENGTPGNDTFRETLGNATVNGGSGVNTVIYQFNQSYYTLSQNVSRAEIVQKSSGGTDTLNSVQRLQFADTKLALDVGGNAGTVAKILGAVFGPSSLSNANYVGIGLNLLDGGMSYANLMQAALNAAGATTSTAVVNLLWTNLFHAMPTADQAAPLVAMLDSGTYSAGALGVLAADSSLNTTNINLVGLQQTGIHFV